MHGSFYGWYMKCQSDTQTLAVIPAVHQAGQMSTCSIQIITDDNAWTVTFPAERYKRKGKNISIGANRFSERGIRLNMRTPDLFVKGKIDFGALSPLKYDIMGPFAAVPFLECRHSVWSMQHSVCGSVGINGKEYSFQDGCGYWEGDRGRSFPKEYLWTQCCFPYGSLMLSVADIPMAGRHFTGIIGIVLWQGREYRLATYLGAKVVKNQNGMIHIVQGNLELEAHILGKDGRVLKAPADGDMVRTIQESVACRAFYRFRKKNRTLFAFETERASFEYDFYVHLT